jgi:hypothetical protein
MSLFETEAERGWQLSFRINSELLSKMAPSEQTEEVCIMAVERDADNLKYVVDQTRTVCYEAIRRNPDTLQYVWDQTDDICLLAVMTDGLVLRYVQNQTEEICLAAVKQNPEAIIYVKSQTYRIKEAAIKRDGMMLRYITFPTEYFYELALKQNPNAIIFIKDPTDEQVDYVLEQNPGLISVVEQTEERRSKVLENCPACIQYIHEPSTNECIHVVSTDGLCLPNIAQKYRTKSIYFYAVKENPEALDYVVADHPDDDIIFTCGVEACEIGGLKYLFRLKNNKFRVFREIMRNRRHRLFRRVEDKVDDFFNWLCEPR